MLAKHVSDQTLIRLSGLCSKMGSNKAAYALLHERFGLKPGWLAKFHNGNRPNPTVDSLDRLVTALDTLDASCPHRGRSATVNTNQ